MSDLQVVALPMGEFTFAADEPSAGQTGVVVAYAIRHPNGVFLFDSGFGFGNQELDDDLQRPRARLARGPCRGRCQRAEDHGDRELPSPRRPLGQNLRFPGIPIHVQLAERAIAHGHDRQGWPS